MDIDQVIIILAVYHSILELKLNNENELNLTSGYLHSNMVNGVGITALFMCPPLLKGQKVIGQLAAQLFHGQVCVVPSSVNLQVSR